MSLCYYITGHGYGHAIRTTQILKALPADVPLILRTTAPERLFREELPGRAFEYVHAEYDCGCLQSDSVTVLKRETLTRYGEIARRNYDTLPAEIAFLQACGARCVVSDVPSFPLFAAQQAGIPGLAVANFTWHDIYDEYAKTPDDAALLAQMASEYASATLALITPLNTITTTGLFPSVVRVPLVARQGRKMREELLRVLEIPAGKHLALVYLGGWGLGIDRPALETCCDWVFLVDRPLAQTTGNVRSFDPAVLHYADVAASVNAVVSKAGYGTVTECIANSVPLVYLPRDGFCEHQALVLGMNTWGGGVEISESDFFGGCWNAALKAALDACPNPNAFATDGAKVIANQIMEYYNR